MGYDIVGMNKNGKQVGGHLSISGWSLFLLLASEYGWEPEGTKLYVWTHKSDNEQFTYVPQDENADDGHWGYATDWDGSYFGNEGQTISKEDTNNIAVAIEQFLTEAPFDDAWLIRKCRQIENTDRDFFTNFFKTWALPENRELLLNMISVLKTGPCVII